MYYIHFLFIFEVKVTPLTLAAEKNNLKLLKELIMHGADINTQAERGGTALCLAAAHGHIDCVQELIRLGADLEESRYVTPLGLACSAGYLTVVQELIAAGAKVNVDDYNMKLMGSRASREIGAYVDVKNQEVIPYHIPPIMMAAFGNQVAVVQELIKK